MTYAKQNLIDCSKFEELLTDYLDKTLDRPTFKAAAEHAIACPLCHALLNEVKGALAVCRDLGEPRAPMTRLEARILASTVPNAALHCDIEQGFISSAIPLLANVAYRLGRQLKFNGEKEQFDNDPEADAMLTREYRKPYIISNQV